MTPVRFWLVHRADEIRIEFSDGSMSVFTLRDGCIIGLDDEPLARIAYAIRDHGDTDPRFRGWDASVDAALGECDAAWEQKGRAA